MGERRPIVNTESPALRSIMTLVPPDWESLGRSVGPFGPGELEVRECQEDPSQTLRMWQVRMAARPEAICTAHLSTHGGTSSLSQASEIKAAIAFRLCAI